MSDTRVANELKELTSILPADEIITAESDLYLDNSQTWSVGKNLHPKLVIRPNSVESLAKAVKYLNRSSLHFNIRNSGAGDASAHDVLISTRAFNSFQFDRENEIVTIGAGSLWREYHENMKKVDPDYSVVAAATPFIGVGGSVLAAGFSLMSKENGCSSDPENLLDAEIVKLDGSVVWASTEPDLMWGLRGAHLGLGVVTRLKMRARKYPRDIWGGPILIHRSKEREIAQAIAGMDQSEGVNNKVFALVLLMPEMIMINAFDAQGEKHGRETFAPLLHIEGAMDNTAIMDLEAFANMQAPGEAGKGTKHVFWNPLALGKLSEEVVLRFFQWQSTKMSQGVDASVMFELWGVRPSSSGPAASAWPRSSKCRHFCVLSLGAPADASAEDVAKARATIQEGPKDILGSVPEPDLVAASALDDYHDIEKIYGANWPRVLAVKRKYDPEAKIQGSPLARACAAYMRETPGNPQWQTAV